jgi:hypothetical protein
MAGAQQQQQQRTGAAQRAAAQSATGSRQQPTLRHRLARRREQQQQQQPMGMARPMGNQRPRCVERVCRGQLAAGGGLESVCLACKGLSLSLLLLPVLLLLLLRCTCPPRQPLSLEELLQKKKAQQEQEAKVRAGGSSSVGQVAGLGCNSGVWGLLNSRSSQQPPQSTATAVNSHSSQQPQQSTATAVNSCSRGQPQQGQPCMHDAHTNQKGRPERWCCSSTRHNLILPSNSSSRAASFPAVQQRQCRRPPAPRPTFSFHSHASVCSMFVCPLLAPRSRCGQTCCVCSPAPHATHTSHAHSPNF